MDNNLMRKKGTIANFLCRHKEEIWSQPTVKDMQQKVLTLLEDKSLKNNPEISQAKLYFSRSSGNQFLSLLNTYMLGISLSKKY